MIRKAKENLDSARILKDCHMPDGVANRAYYSVYQAGWHFLVAGGHEVPVRNGREYWPHDRILDVLENAGMCPFSGWDEDFDYLQCQRVKADYRPDSVNEGRMDDIIEHAEKIVQWVIDHDP